MSFYYQDKRRVLPFDALRRISNRINVAKAEQSERGQQLLRRTLIAIATALWVKKKYIFIFDRNSSEKLKQKHDNGNLNKLK